MEKDIIPKLLIRETWYTIKKRCLTLWSAGMLVVDVYALVQQCYYILWTLQQTCRWRPFPFPVELCPCIRSKIRQNKLRDLYMRHDRSHTSTHISAVMKRMFENKTLTLFLPHHPPWSLYSITVVISTLHPVVTSVRLLRDVIIPLFAPKSVTDLTMAWL